MRTGDEPSFLSLKEHLMQALVESHCTIFRDASGGFEDTRETPMPTVRDANSLSYPMGGVSSTANPIPIQQ